MSDTPVVYLIDDDETIRDSLSFLLETTGVSVRTFESAGDFLAVSGGCDSGCVITDIRMPGMSGTELLNALKKTGFTLPVIVITGHGDVPLAVEAMKLGAFDFIEKPFADDTIIAAMDKALREGERRQSEESGKADILLHLESLSQRERQVLDGLVAGQANKVIAHELGISPRTVEVYRANVMAKMEAGSLSDLVRMALLAGVVATPD